MTYRNYLLGLTKEAINCLSVGSSICLVCFGVSLIKSSSIALKVANTQIVVSTHVEKLEGLAGKLEKQAKVIQQKDTAYSELKAIYRQSLKGEKKNSKLNNAINAIEELPKVENIEEIQTELSQTEKVLRENISK